MNAKKLIIIVIVLFVTMTGTLSAIERRRDQTKHDFGWLVSGSAVFFF